ncbi:MAG: choice-of-anchor I family protein [Ferruginibacter sp.]
MKKSFTPYLFSIILFSLFQNVTAQNIITQWNFNSPATDANTATGTLTASLGSGTIINIGGTTTSFASGDADGGSSDPATGDDSGMGVTTFPGATSNNKTAGIQFITSTSGFQNIIVTYDLRHSNTAARHEQFQYTLDKNAAPVVWQDFANTAGATGSVWFPRSFDLSGITALNNNPNAGFRVVSSFDPVGSAYIATNTGSTYAAGGTWRFDMVTVKGISTGGSDVTPPVAQSFTVTSSTTSVIQFSEAVTSSSATITTNYSFNPSLAATNASLSPSGNVVTLTHVPLTDGLPYTVTVSGVQDIALNTMASTDFNILFNASTPNLVITEIIHSPNDIEMIEVYNAGATAINVGGLKWAVGTTGNFPVVTMPAGSALVFATSPSTASTTLNVSPVYTILNGLGSTEDILVIRNSLNVTVDTVAYFVGSMGWPSLVTGVYGYSFELNAATNDNNLGSNWFVPQNPVTPQPPQGIIRATPGIYPTPPFTPVTPTVSFLGSRISVSETTTTVNITANIQGGNSNPSSVDIEVLPVSTATGNSDYTLPASLQFDWVANSNNVNDIITITINNDALPENAEYFIVRFINPVNIMLPPASANNFTVAIRDEDKQAPVASQVIQLNHIASFSNGAAGTNSAEIVAHDPASQRLFIANSIAAKIDIVNFSNPAAATLISSIPVSTYGNINSIAVKNGIVAAAIENTIPESPGKVVFFDINGVFLSQVTVGAMPDMITFTNDGSKVLTANEGQPKSDYTVDPEGSVSIIDISGGVQTITQAAVSTAGFSAFIGQEASLRTAGVRLFGVGANVAQDMEPEYITFSEDGLTAYVTCQENNAIAVINISSSTVTEIRPLGTKNYNLPVNAFDANDQSGTVEIANWPVKGLYMPDAIASYTVAGQTYYVTANEGDAREYSALTEIVRLNAATYILDPTVFAYPDALKANIGRLNVTTASGDTDGDGDFDEIHTFGARSISIWNATTGALVWDSGEQLELIISKHPVFGAIFNASNSNNTLKNRSDDKGPEPEGVTIATILGKTFAFVALERIGGCIVYDITDPLNPIYVDYKNTRTIGAYGGDNGSEGIIFISAANSPTGNPIVVLANEVSSTLTFYNVDAVVVDISLSGIKARNVGSRNLVEWTTAGEEIGDIFELEKSDKGTGFKFMATLPAKGKPSAYNYYDENPFEGVTYYRLKMKHTSGRITYSEIVNVNRKNNESFVQVFPNPATDVLNLKINQQLLNASIEISDMRGVVIRKEKITDRNAIIDVRSLPAGIYTIKYFNNNFSQSLRITKQ